VKTEAFAEIESESTQLAVTRTPERASLCANIFSWSTSMTTQPIQHIIILVV